FTDDFFLKYLHDWLKKGHAKHKTSHVTKFKDVKVGGAEKRLGAGLASQLRREKAIMGVFDEGCMGMFNAIIPDSLLNPTGVFKERLSQSALYPPAPHESDDDAQQVFKWYLDHGMQFRLGAHEESDLTERQIKMQCKTYIAAM